MNYFLEKIIRKISKYKAKKEGLFSTTNIETYGFCNRKCKFCFNNDRFPNRDEGIMDETLYYKIIDEFSSLHYTGRISPQFYGEPLLDKRIVKFIAYARKKNPFAYIKFASNGDKLTEELLVELINNGLGKIYITNYNDLENENCLKLSQKYQYHVTYRNYKDIKWVNRAGQLYKNKKNKNANKPCLRPSTQLVINWKGNVLLCCNDYYEKYIFGNVKNESILKIWNSNSFKNYRTILKEKGGRKKIEICKNCDAIR